MTYRIEFTPTALKDLDALSADVAQRVIRKISAMSNDLAGDVKRLTQFTPEYRLRVGDYRVLFDVQGDTITIYRVRHRREVYDR